MTLSVLTYMDHVNTKFCLFLDFMFIVVMSIWIYQKLHYYIAPDFNLRLINRLYSLGRIVILLALTLCTRCKWEDIVYPLFCESLCYCLVCSVPFSLRHLCLLHQVKAILFQTRVGLLLRILVFKFSNIGAHMNESFLDG